MNAVTDPSGNSGSGPALGPAVGGPSAAEGNGVSQIVLSLSAPEGWLALAGASLHTGAHLFRSQIVLRVLLAAGTFLYIGYYFVASDEPLWPAILGTSAIAIGSVAGLARVIRARHRARWGGVRLAPGRDWVT